jgi:Xaa-Pro aminopeptidase/Xaa-Pro dipeptidase
MYSLGSEWTQCANIVCSGPYTAPYRRFTSDRVILPGDFVIIDIGALLNGYYGDFTRTWLCGKDVKPTKEQIEIHMKCYNALVGCQKAIKPGATTWEVSRASGEQILGGRLGHGIGIGAMEPPYFGSENLIPKDKAVVLEPGMIFSVEPYDGIPGIGGVRLENNFLVTEDGCELISHFPFEERLLQ